MTGADGSRHLFAVLAIGLVALLWGGSFAAMKLVVQAGLSVGALLCVRFSVAGLALAALAWACKARFDRRSLRDSLWLGLVLTAIFWLQTDGLRYTTTSKSAFITGLYVVFTPLVSLFARDRLRASHGIGALVAAGGLFLLVNEPGKRFGGWNFGDSETLACAVLCGLHISMTAHFSRRSDSWILAAGQVATVALVSWLVTPFVPASPLADGTRLGGFHGAWVALAKPSVWIPMLYLSLAATALAFYVQSSQQAHLGATEAAILFTLEPVFSAVLAVSGVLPGIHEQLSGLQMAGGGVIVGAMLLAELGPRLRRRPGPAENDAIG